MRLVVTGTMSAINLIVEGDCNSQGTARELIELNSRLVSLTYLVFPLSPIDQNLLLFKNVPFFLISVVFCLSVFSYLLLPQYVDTFVKQYIGRGEDYCSRVVRV